MEQTLQTNKYIKHLKIKNHEKNCITCSTWFNFGNFIFIMLQQDPPCTSF